MNIPNSLCSQQVEVAAVWGQLLLSVNCRGNLSISGYSEA